MTEPEENALDRIQPPTTPPAESPDVYTELELTKLLKPADQLRYLNLRFDKQLEQVREHQRAQLSEQDTELKNLREKAEAYAAIKEALIETRIVSGLVATLTVSGGLFSQFDTPFREVGWGLLGAAVLLIVVQTGFGTWRFWKR